MFPRTWQQLDLSLKSAIRKLFKAKSADPRTYSPHSSPFQGTAATKV